MVCSEVDGSCVWCGEPGDQGPGAWYCSTACRRAYHESMSMYPLREVVSVRPEVSDAVPSQDPRPGIWWVLLAHEPDWSWVHRYQCPVVSGRDPRFLMGLAQTIEP
jgi:hypothetical protein